MHKTVLLQETIDGLDIKTGYTIVDCTLNNGGHTIEILKRFGSNVNVIGIDADQSAIDRAEKRIGKRENFLTACDNFRNLDSVLASFGQDKVAGFIFDLGLSSDQLESSGRGFTFQKDEQLSMTFGLAGGEVNAKQIVNDWGEDTIATILSGYGEESFAPKIAKAIVHARKQKMIETTFELVVIIKSAVPIWYQKRKTHPATKTFQALRMAVNDEVSALEEALEKSFKHLKADGRIAIISFHSIEDRIVKKFFREKAKSGEGKLITKKPIVSTREEISENPRSRSAKLRIIEKLTAK